MLTVRGHKVCSKLFIVILSTCLIFSFFNTDGHTQDWQPIVSLVTTPSYFFDPLIKAFDANIHVIWQDYRDNGKHQVYYKHSKDKGDSWIPGIRLSVDPNRSYDEALAVWNNNVHVVWSDTRHYPTDGSIELYYRRSTNNGDSFEGEVRLTTTADDNRYSVIGVFENTVHLIWMTSKSVTEVNYIRSDDNGSTWSVPIILSNPADGISFPQISAFGNNVMVVWEKWHPSMPKSEICYRRSRDNGNNWDPEVTLINAGVYDQYPFFSLFNDKVHITWARETSDPQGDIYYIRSTNFGDDWSPETRLTFDDVPISAAPVSVFGESVHLVWSEDEDGDGTSEISYLKSLDNGETWEPEFRLSPQANDAYAPSIAAFNEDVYVVWEEKGEIFFRRSSLPPSAAEKPGALPGEFQLFQNYPNPFNPKTTLKFYLPQPAEVILSIIDINGKVIKRFQQGLLNPGMHSVQWASSNESGDLLPSGIYYYRIDARAGETRHTDVKKMIFVQ